MAYDPSNPPSLITQGIGGPTGLRWYALVWIDPIADVLVPGYISNAELVGMRPGDGLVYKDVNRGEWDHYDLIVSTIGENGAATVAFPEVPEEALPLVDAFPDPEMVQLVAYQSGRQVRGRLNDLVEFTESEYKTFTVGGAVQQVDIGTDFPVPIVYINNVWQNPSSWTLQNGLLQSNGGTWPSGTLTAWIGGTRTFITAMPLIYSTDVVNFVESVQDTMAATLVAGNSNISIVYDDLTNRIFISSSGSGGGGGVTAHGALSGLSADDHPQYLNNARGDVRYYRKQEVDLLIEAVEGSGGGGGVSTATKYLTGTISTQSINIDSAFPYPILTIGGVQQSPTTYTLSGGIITSISGDWPVGASYTVWVGGNETFVATNPLPPAASDVQGLQEAVEDFLNNSLLPGTGITKDYNDTTGKLTIAATAQPSYSVFNPIQFGAVGNDVRANKGSDTAGLQAAINALNKQPNHTLDLLGKTYWINAPLKTPAGEDYNFCRMTNGWVRATEDFPVGEWMFDMRPSSGAYNTTIDNVKFHGAGDSAIGRAGGGIIFGETQELRIDRCDIEGFRTAGIRQTSPKFGRQTYITNCQIFGIGANNPATGIDMYGGDNNIFDSTIRDCDTLVRFREGAQIIRGCHIYMFDTLSDRGIVVDKPSHVMIEGNYIDSCGIILDGLLEGANTDMIRSCGISNNRFLTHPFRDMFGAFAFIKVQPRTASRGIRGLLVTDNAFQKNREQALEILPIKEERVFGGALDFGAIRQFHMKNNVYDGVTAKVSDPWVDLIFSGGTTTSANVAVKVPFGNIARIRGHTVEGAVGAPQPLSFTKSGQTISAKSVSNYQALVHVQVSINDNESV